MSDFLADQAYEAALLRDAFVARGFTDDGDVLLGDVSWRAGDGGEQRWTAVRLEVGEAFPFGPPAVFLDERRLRPSDPSPTFHMETNGALCLYDRDVEVHDAPWRDADALLSKIAGWVERTSAGWPGDTDTDLERYLPSDGGFLLYDADELEGRTGVLRLDGVRLRWSEPVDRRATRPGGKPGRSGRRTRRVVGPAAYLLDVGELVAPVLTWPQLLELAARDARPLGRLVQLGTVRTAVLRYTRGGRPGVLALALQRSPNEPGGVGLAALEAADLSLASRQLRAGVEAASLGSVRVAVVGCGAIGSFVADLLLRSGVRRLLLLDHQRLRPGNVVRHLAGDRYVGRLKADAVLACLTSTGLPVEQVSARHALISTAREACDFAREYDLVIDATGDQRAAALLQAATQDVGVSLVKVCLQREGGIIRVDRFPLRPGETHAPSVPALPTAAPWRERGCGDVVSMTPPYAVTAAASAAVRISVALLTGTASEASHVDVLAVQPDPPYNCLGPVRPPEAPAAARPAATELHAGDQGLVRLVPHDPAGDLPGQRTASSSVLSGGATT